MAVTLDVLSERLPDHLEATTYYIVSEALTNVAKHANAGEARVTVAREGDVLRCEIADDGRGGADASRGSGITGLRDRAEAAGGTLVGHQPAGPRHGHHRGSRADVLKSFTESSEDSRPANPASTTTP